MQLSSLSFPEPIGQNAAVLASVLLLRVTMSLLGASVSVRGSDGSQSIHKVLSQRIDGACQLGASNFAEVCGLESGNQYSGK